MVVIAVGDIEAAEDGDDAVAQVHRRQMLALFRRVVVGHQRELASCKRILDDRPEGIDHGENGGAAGATDQKEAQGIAETPQDHGTVRAGPPDERRVDQNG